jgi:NADP-dependent 3-hydroxy acid dehydrogenase YdfG
MSFQSVSPGLTLTDIFEAGNVAVDYKNIPAIKPEDVADAVLYLLTTPYHLNVTELTLKHQSQKF